MQETTLTKQDKESAIEPTRQMRWRTPAVDIFENKNELLIRADLPGVSRLQLDVRVDEGQLIIEGHRDKPGETKRALLHEFDIESFHRAFTVPSYVDATKVSAEIDEGVLTVHLPRAERAKPRQIPIKAGK